VVLEVVGWTGVAMIAGSLPFQAYAIYEAVGGSA
jgi:hypothetical protein